MCGYMLYMHSLYAMAHTAHGRCSGSPSCVGATRCKTKTNTTVHRGRFFRRKNKNNTRRQELQNKGRTDQQHRDRQFQGPTASAEPSQPGGNKKRALEANPPLNCLWRPPPGARAPKTEFLRLYQPNHRPAWTPPSPATWPGEKTTKKTSGAFFRRKKRFAEEALCLFCRALAPQGRRR
jgi:hypothetical protein